MSNRTQLAGSKKLLKYKFSDVKNKYMYPHKEF